MSKKKIYVCSDLIRSLTEIVHYEGYEALYPVFDNVDPSFECLEMDVDDARHLLHLADLELAKMIPLQMQKKQALMDMGQQCLNTEDMVGIYEKTQFYIQSEFAELRL